MDEPVSGADRGEARRRRLALALLAPIALLFLLVDLGTWSLWGDEALYGGVAIDTAAAGRLLPMLIDDDDYVSKPIGGFLFLRAAFALWGPTEVAARLPSVAAALAAVLLVAHAGGRWFGAAHGFLAGLFLVTAPRALGFHAFRSGTFDALLLLATSAVLVLWIESVRRGSRGRWLAACGVAALSALIKNLAGPGLAGAAVLVGELGLPRRSDEPLHLRLVRAVTRGGALVAVGGLVFGGYLFLLDRLGVKNVIVKLVERDMVLRAQGDLHIGHERLATYYLDEIVHDFGIALALLMPFAFGLVRRLRDPRLALAERAAWVGVASWFGTMLLAVTLFRSKLPWYVLPTYPGLALALAAGCGELVRLRARPLIVAALGATLAATQLVGGVRTLQGDPVRTPLHDLPRVLDALPEARFHVQPNLKWGVASETTRLRPQGYFYLRRLGERAIRAWPDRKAPCAIVYLERHGAVDFQARRSQWRRYELPPNLENDGGRFLLLERCEGRILRLLGGNADQVPGEPLRQLGRGRRTKRSKE